MNLMNPLTTKLIPSTEDLRAAYDGPDAMLDSCVVTLMMRHLPRTYTLNELTGEIDAVVPTGAYNYVHLPWDHKRGSNITYVFVNFISPEWAMRTFLLLSGRSWAFVQSPKVCRIAAAFLQGLGPNLANYALNCGIQAGSSNAPAVFTCDRQQMDLQLAVKCFCTPGDFHMARAQALKTQEGAQAAATLTKVSAQTKDVESKLTHEMLMKNVDTKQPCKMPMNGQRDEQVATHGCNPSMSSSSCFSCETSELQQNQQILRAHKSPDLSSTPSTASDSISYSQSLSDQDPMWEGPNPTLAVSTQNQDQDSRGLILTTQATRHHAAHNQTLRTLKAAGILSHDSVQHAASHGTWFVPSLYSNDSSPTDQDSDELLASIKFYTVDLNLGS